MGGGGWGGDWQVEPESRIVVLFNGMLITCVLGNILHISTTAADSECKIFLMDRLLK